VLAIRYSAATAVGARQGSHAFAVAYLNDRADKAKANIASQITSLQSQVKTLSQQLQVVTGKIADLPTNSPDRTLAIAQQSILISQISTLNDKLAPLQSAQVTPGDIISDASTPTTTGMPKSVLALSGLLGGLLIGLAGAFAADRLGRRLRTADDIARATDEPVLVEVPRGASTNDPVYARLANRVAAAAPAGSTIVVAGAASETASREVAEALDKALTRRQRISADMLDSGGRVPDSASQRYTVIPTGSLLEGADAQRLAEDAHGTVVVVTRGTRKAQLRQALQRLDEVNALCLGTILTSKESRRTRTTTTTHPRTGAHEPAAVGSGAGFSAVTGSRTVMPLADDAGDATSR
jgi:hypothetical protein